MKTLGCKENPFTNTADIWQYSQSRTAQNINEIGFIYVSMHLCKGWMWSHLNNELKNRRVLVIPIEPERDDSGDLNKKINFPYHTFADNQIPRMCGESNPPQSDHIRCLQQKRSRYDRFIWGRFLKR